jgi:hypothetical protein
MLPITLYDPSLHVNPLAGGYLTYGQLPATPLYVQPFPPSSLLAVTDVFEVAPLATTTGANGTTLNTSGTNFVISPGYEPVAYFSPLGTIKIPTGRSLTLTPNQGYAGFTNYDIKLLDDFDIDSASLVPVNQAFPILDPIAGFSIEFDLAITQEQSNLNRAGFSFTVISNELSKGAEFGFKEAGTNSDYIFIQNANLNAATEGEKSSAPLEISNPNRYRVTFEGSSYNLFVNDNLLLNGALRDYSFNPQNSTPPFPSSINPYETQNFIFFGDNTDQGYSEFTLGKIVISPLDLPPQEAFPDFNNDGNADIVWRHRLTGANALWLMQGTTPDSEVALLPNQATDWQLRALGDFDNNGTADLVWQHATTGQVELWRMEGNGVLEEIPIESDLSPAWKVAAVADFDRDGQIDLLWRNVRTGQNQIWLMDCTTLRRSIPLLATSPNWDIAAVGDFTQDNRPEILWRHRVSGRNVVWHLDDNFAVTETSTLPSVGASWDLVGAADFTQDGNLDLLWRQRSAGNTVIWEMDGLNRLNSVVLPTVNPHWVAMV